MKVYVISDDRGEPVIVVKASSKDTLKRKLKKEKWLRKGETIESLSDVYDFKLVDII